MLKTEISSVFRGRREKLMTQEPEACFIFFGAIETIRNGDVHHFPFRQDSDFLYLTDFDEPNAALVLVDGKSHLFILEQNPEQEMWHGERYAIDRAKSVFQVDEVFLMSEFYSKLDSLLSKAKKVFYALGSQNDDRVIRAVKQAIRHQGKGSFGNLPIFDPMPLLTQLRVIKDADELELIRRACSASARAHLQILKRARVGMTEFEVLAEFQYAVYKNGCRDLGYGPIVASGLNATTLHYVRCNELLKHGDLLLVDAGGTVNSYTADITQTFPLSGAFSPEQKKVYAKVLEVNRAITAMIKPGVTYRELHQKSVDMLTDALLSLGILSGSLAENIESQSYRKYYPHGLGHYLGLDVHDLGMHHEREKDFELQAGMVLTNEPGLYFRERGSPYYGIGVRIEDDLLVTAEGAEVLTRELPRDIDQIENLRAISNA